MLQEFTICGYSKSIDSNFLLYRQYQSCICWNKKKVFLHTLTPPQPPIIYQIRRLRCDTIRRYSNLTRPPAETFRPHIQFGNLGLQNYESSSSFDSTSDFFKFYIRSTLWFEAFVLVCNKYGWSTNKNMESYASNSVIVIIQRFGGGDPADN